jgi:hypothetical protein
MKPPGKRNEPCHCAINSRPRGTTALTAVQEIVEQFRASGLSQMEYCRQTGIVLSSLGRYLRRSKSPEPQLVRVKVEAAPEPGTGFVLMKGEIRGLNGTRTPRAQLGSMEYRLWSCISPQTGDRRNAGPPKRDALLGCFSWEQLSGIRAKVHCSSRFAWGSSMLTIRNGHSARPGGCTIRGAHAPMRAMGTEEVIRYLAHLRGAAAGFRVSGCEFALSARPPRSDRLNFGECRRPRGAGACLRLANEPERTALRWCRNSAQTAGAQPHYVNA